MLFLKNMTWSHKRDCNNIDDQQKKWKDDLKIKKALKH
jgi:hypothetical protein